MKRRDSGAPIKTSIWIILTSCQVTGILMAPDLHRLAFGRWGGWSGLSSWAGLPSTPLTYTPSITNPTLEGYRTYREFLESSQDSSFFLRRSRPGRTSSTWVCGLYEALQSLSKPMSLIEALADYITRKSHM